MLKQEQIMQMIAILDVAYDKNSIVLYKNNIENMHKKRVSDSSVDNAKINLVLCLVAKEYEKYKNNTIKNLDLIDTFTIDNDLLFQIKDIIDNCIINLTSDKFELEDSGIFEENEIDIYSPELIAKEKLLKKDICTNPFYMQYFSDRNFLQNNIGIIKEFSDFRDNLMHFSGSQKEFIVIRSDNILSLFLNYLENSLSKIAAEKDSIESFSAAVSVYEYYHWTKREDGVEDFLSKTYNEIYNILKDILGN